MTTDIFSIKNDWLKQPTQTLEPYRTIIQYPGSGIKIRKITDDVQIKFTASFTNLTKEDISDLLSYFNSHKGRQKAFWVPVPKNYFTATLDIGSTDVIIRIEDPSPIFLRGYERSYILRNDGSIFFNKIMGLTSSIMTIDAPLGQFVSKDSIAFFGRLIYCRFDQDEIVMQHITTDISECELSFIELPKEYPI